MDEQRAQGYESGADGYLAKPFNAAVLRSRCKNLIANRRLIKELYSTGSAISDVKPNDPATVTAPAGDVENEFYGRFLGIVSAEMGDPELNVDALASKMGLGRSQFYRKIKALTNYTPVELLRNIRLKRSRELLAKTQKTVGEIAYEVGFSTPAYFSRCYKEAYGETPTDLRDRLATKG